MTLKTHFKMTASERAMGRYMRAPDHPTDGGGAEGAAPSTEQDSGNEQLSTEEQLEREFGDDSGSPDQDDDGDDDKDKASESNDDADEDDDDDGEAGDDGDESDESETEGDKVAEPPVVQSEETKALLKRADEAEQELARVKAAAVAKGVSLDIAVDGITAPVEPNPEDYTYGDLDQKYMTDVAKYDAKIEIMQEQAHARFQVEAASLDAKWTKNLTTATAKYPDFDDVVVKGAEAKKWPCPAVIAVGIKDSEYGPDIAYHLASNPDEAIKLSKLSTLEQAREFGRLEEREATKAARAAKKAEREASGKVPNRTSKAPTPPKRQVRGSGGKFRTPADTDDFAAFDKMVDDNKMIRA